MTESAEHGFSLADAEAAKEAGAKAGARARKRLRAESEKQTAAVLAAQRGDRDAAIWQSAYTVDGERRIMRHRETGRETLSPAELLAETRRAVRIAAARLESRHGVPELSHEERADLASELVARILGETSGSMPKRDRMTRAYLTRRAEGIVLDDPERRNTEAGDSGDIDLADLAESAQGRERSRKSAADPMLNPGVDGEWPELGAAAVIVGATDSARRAVSYLVCGGTLLAKPTDCPKVWGISPKNAAQKAVPRGADWLRQPGRIERYRAAVKLSRLLDTDALDHWHTEREWIRRGMVAAPRPPRSVPERRPRTEPDYPAPVTERTDRRIIRSAERRARDAARHGWTEAAK